MPVQPTDKEEEYFARLDAEKKKKLAEEQAKLLAAQQREELKKLHWMRCPKCGMELQSVKYADVEIDQCFNCNGSWLDEGKLEKISAAGSRTHGILNSILRIFK